VGDARKYVLKVDFDRRLRLEFHGAKVTSDAGLLAYRELDDVFSLTEMAVGRLSDSRTGKNTQHSMTALLRQAILGRLAGYEDTNDADRLRVDPAMRHVVGGRARELLGASTSEMSRFETELLACRENILALMDLCGRWIDKTNERTGLKELVLDLDTTPGRHGAIEVRTTDTSAARATIRCFCSTSQAIWNARCSGGAMSTARSTGVVCCFR